MGYDRWYTEHAFVIAPAAAYVGNWLQSFREFPPRQKPGSFNLERVMETVTELAARPGLIARGFDATEPIRRDVGEMIRTGEVA